jgi:hypothetical protein
MRNGEDPAAEKRYSSAECIGTDVRIVQGDPDSEHNSTSYVERQNLTMRGDLCLCRLRVDGRRAGSKLSTRPLLVRASVSWRLLWPHDLQ